MGAALHARGGSSSSLVLDPSTLHSAHSLFFPGQHPAPTALAPGRDLRGQEVPACLLPLPHYPVPACPSLPACLLPPHRLPLPGPCEALQETKTEPN